LDATAEVDEFSKFLNEFKDELRMEKKPVVQQPVATATAATSSSAGSAEDTAVVKKTAKRSWPETERKVVDGKWLRKKVKAANRNHEPTPSNEPGGWRDLQPAPVTPAIQLLQQVRHL